MHGINGAACLKTRHREDRLYVGAEAVLQRSGCHQCIIVILKPFEGNSINQKRLCIRTLHLSCGYHQAFDWICDVMTLI